MDLFLQQIFKGVKILIQRIIAFHNTLLIEFVYLLEVIADLLDTDGLMINIILFMHVIESPKTVATNLAIHIAIIIVSQQLIGTAVLEAGDLSALHKIKNNNISSIVSYNQ